MWTITLFIANSEYYFLSVCFFNEGYYLFSVSSSSCEQGTLFM